MKAETGLLENGLDFITSGLDLMSKPKYKRNLKYGMLHLASGLGPILQLGLKNA
jgi:hypothetical protein